MLRLQSRFGLDPASDVLRDRERFTIHAEKTEQLLRRDGAIRASDHRLVHHRGDRAVVADNEGQVALTWPPIGAGMFGAEIGSDRVGPALEGVSSLFRRCGLQWERLVVCRGTLAEDEAGAGEDEAA